MILARSVSFKSVVLLLGVVALGLWLLSVEFAVVGGGAGGPQTPPSGPR